METFNYKCPNCGANVEFDPATNLFYCASCGQFYQIGEVKTNKKADEEESVQSWHNEALYENVEEKVGTLQSDQRPEETEESLSTDSAEFDKGTVYMEINIFHCSSCGAEIMTNDVEVSKNCAYCGQSTIIFDRVSKERRPDKILPFKITKEDALTKVKERFAKASYLPDEVDNISVNSVYGIYMPYWVYDSHMEMGIYSKGTKKSRGFDEFGTKDMPVTLDASRRLNDNVSIKLNPFPIEDAVEFDPGYLSGFFADKYDVSYEERKDHAKQLIKTVLEAELNARVPGSYSPQMKETYGQTYEKLVSYGNTYSTYGEKYELKSVEYTFLPVYFFTFRIKNRLINILVNGANGRIVGSVPVDENKIKKAQTKYMIIYAIVFGLVAAALFRWMPTLWAAGVFLILTGSCFLAGTTSKKKYEKMYKETNSASMFSISRNRE